ncbi:4-coumarate--CoA ligase 1 [Orussus abietinus]|uniref:4-coumarate--CoA ligase 1 n=1 Tax=Orussus abietinus TaxID=222816 RepID=UPI0006262A8F|nr:4-coumarate--CoA ligase 1 [Orussus abietinus]XP_012272245.1 4-coumarate--CoA ligase 1 [Orussus abietinus]XP_012272247.1 4-coumarate--CoA ligase 1 [Orussus abietinus]
MTPKAGDKAGARIFRGPPAPKLQHNSVGDFLLDGLRKHQDRIAAVDVTKGEAISYGDVLRESIKLAEFLRLLGLKMGDRICIFSENRLDWVLPMCATFYLGAVLVPINPAYTEGEARHILSIAKPRIIFVSKKSEKVAQRTAQSFLWPLEIILLGEEDSSNDVPALRSVLRGVKNPPDPGSYKAVSIPNFEKCGTLLLSSSGTTGRPKCVQLSHRNVLTYLTISLLPEWVDIRENDKVFIFLPLFHGYGFSLLMGVLRAGATAVLSTGFEPQKFLQTIQDHKVTHVPIVPPIMVFLAKSLIVTNYDLGSVREFICGAAPLSKDVHIQVWKRTGIWARNAYGLTEHWSAICLCPRNVQKFETAGILLPSAHCKIIDVETSKILGPYQRGELCVKGDLVMLGYYENPEATAAMIDQEGWMHTGDIGYYDDEEFIFIVDRLKELIKYKGSQIAPAELEDVLLSHPEVKDAAVVGKPDEVAGEIPVAFVVLQPGSKISPNEIRRYVDGKVSSWKWLRGGVRLVNEIPKSPSGKILRKELSKLVAHL